MSKRTVLITGSSRGIGAAAARRFAQEGWGVGLHCHTDLARAQGPGPGAAGPGGPVGLYPGDVAERAQVDQVMEGFLQDFGHLDVLVCNAGLARQELFTDISLDSWRQMLGVNVGRSVPLLPGGPAPHDFPAKAGKIITRLLHVGTGGGLPVRVAYSAAKAGGQSA